MQLKRFWFHYKTDRVKSSTKWTKTENVSLCRKNILATKKVQIEFFRILLAYVLIVLDIPDREVSNVTVHAVVQPAVQMKDGKKNLIVLEIDVAEKCARKTCYNILRWLFEGLVDYYVSVQSKFLTHVEGTPCKRLLSDRGGPILHNSAGKGNCRPLVPTQPRC